MTKSNKRDQALISFKKAHTHLSKVLNMLENGEYCINIMQQNLAVIGLLKSAHQSLMENHLKSCFITAMNTANQAKKDKMIKEILTVTKLANK
jgi:CsoR family transcriptional regulator, copper-sensing transcriptional repressor